MTLSSPGKVARMDFSMLEAEEKVCPFGKNKLRFFHQLVRIGARFEWPISRWVISPTIPIEADPG